MTLARRTRLLVRIVCLGAALLWIVLLAADPHLLESIELDALDAELRTTPARAVAPEIVIAAVDERTVQRHGPLPWPPAQMAEFVTTLDRYAPRVIALDMVFTGEREASGGLVAEARASQQPLLRVLERAGKVVLGIYFDFGVASYASRVPAVRDLRHRRLRRLRYLSGGSPQAAVLLPVPEGNAVHTNTPELSVAARAYGHLNLLPGPDGVVRWTPLVARYQGDLYASFAVEVARTYLGDDEQAEVLVGRGRLQGLRLGRREVVTDEHGRLLVGFAGRGGSYARVSVADVLAGGVPAEQLHDRVVLVGSTAPGLADIWSTPLDPLLPGVEIHANVIDNLLHGGFLVRNWFTRLLTFLLLAALGLLGALLLPRRSLRQLGILTVVFVVALVVGHYLVFTHTGYYLNLVSPLLATATMLGGTLGVKYLTEEKQRRQVERCFEHYLDPSVVADLLEQPERLSLGGERRDLSVLFCDIRNFTSLAEGIPPEASVEMLNEFFTAMTEVVFASGGLVDKFVGDQIMAFWGAPVECREHATAACGAALAMMEEFARLRQQWESRHHRSMACGVGINSGPMVVGNIGSAQRFAYTVIGDNVNVAARLQALNKLYATYSLVGPATYAAAREKFRFREIDQVRVRGRTQALTVYELLARADQSALDLDWLQAFAEGLAAYRRRDWSGAARAFAAARTRNPADGCAEFYLRRAEYFAQNPPAADWDGVLYLR